MPAIGEMKVYTGAGWMRLAPGSVVDPETVGWPPAMPKPMKWDPAAHGEREPEPDEDGGVDDPVISELLEVLLCPNCDMELSAAACTPQHAYLADNPMEHRLLVGLLTPYLKQLRFEEGRLCSSCTFAAEHDVVLASEECNHVDARGDQVLISTVQWAALAVVVADARGALAGIEDRLTDQEESLGDLLIWHYEHRDVEIAHLGAHAYWRRVAGTVLAVLTKRLETT
jgi:hypothetical protein